MGNERDLNEGDKRNRARHLTDPEVCKYYLAGLSPYYLFKNTKSDLGEYDKECDDECREAYQALPQNEKDRLGYEYDLLVLLDRLVQQCDQRVKRHSERIRAEHQEELEKIAAALSEGELERMGDIDAEIQATEAGEEVEGSASALGLAGKVDEALACLNRVEPLRRELQSLETKALNAARNFGTTKAMLVCEVSGNFMNSTDNGDRLRCHFEGKQYQGWKLIREKLKMLQKERPPARGGGGGSGGGGGGGDRDRDRGGGGSNSTRDRRVDERYDDRRRDNRGDDRRRDDRRQRSRSRSRDRRRR